MKQTSHAPNPFTWDVITSPTLFRHVLSDVIRVFFSSGYCSALKIVPYLKSGLTTQPHTLQFKHSIVHRTNITLEQIAWCQVMVIFPSTITGMYCTRQERPWGFQEAEAPRFPDNRHRTMVRLPALRTGRFTPQEIPWYSFLLRVWIDPRAIVRLEGCHCKIPKTPSGNRTRDRPASSAVPHPTAPLRTPKNTKETIFFFNETHA